MNVIQLKIQQIVENHDQQRPEGTRLREDEEYL